MILRHTLLIFSCLAVLWAFELGDDDQAVALPKHASMKKAPGMEDFPPIVDP